MLVSRLLQKVELFAAYDLLIFAIIYKWSFFVKTQLRGDRGELSLYLFNDF